MSLPQDLQTAYETFTLLAMKHEFYYAALLIGRNPPDALIIGNVTERGHALAQLLRLHADYIDQKTDAGQVKTETPNPNAN